MGTTKIVSESMKSLDVVPGITGYQNGIEQFVQLNESVDFYKLHECILHLVPKSKSSILDLGAGSGRDAAALAGMGHNVIAIDPMTEFLKAAEIIHSSSKIQWVNDSLPKLVSFSPSTESFDFILCHGVWQHLNEDERSIALERISQLLKPRGLFALALRHGPAGLGTYCFPASVDKTIVDAGRSNLNLVLNLREQSSVIANKPGVTWTRLGFEKCAGVSH